MSRDCKNLYQEYRIAAGYTQEQASDLLHIGLRTLSGYETGDKVPCDIVVKMADIYEDETILLRHISTCPIGKKLLGECHAGNLQERALYARTEIADVVDLDRGISLAARDGKITPDELPFWKKAMKESQEAAKRLLELVCTPVEKEKPPVLAHRRLAS